MASPPSQTSLALSDYYARKFSDLRAANSLRRDVKPEDAPFTDTMLARNFNRVALYTEYTLENGSFRPTRGTSPLRRWAGPIKVELRQGASLSMNERQADREILDGLLSKLAPIINRDIALVPEGGNFLVMVLSEDERRAEEALMRRFVPGIDRASLQALLNPPREVSCLVVAFSESQSATYQRAIALVRAELPAEMREACFHEEIAQGLGLANDHPNVRPSVFNDDEEFMLLTEHDILLLKILYDERLHPGMTLDEVTSPLRQISTELLEPSPV